MKTLVLKLEEAAIGTFEKIGVLTIPININATVNNYGSIALKLSQPNVTKLKIRNGTLYSDSGLTNSIGSEYLIPSTSPTIYFKIAAANTILEINNLYNVIALGNSGYMFGETASRARGYVYTKDLFKMKNLTDILVSQSCMLGELKDVQPTISNLRVESAGISGSLSDIDGNIFSTLRIRQPLVTGSLADLEGKQIQSLLLETPLVEGNVSSLINVVSGVLTIGVISTSFTPTYPMVCDLNEDVFFPELTSFLLRRVHLTRNQLLNTLKSLKKTTWKTVSGSQVILTTTMTQSAYNADTEIQTAVSELQPMLLGTYTINFAN